FPAWLGHGVEHAAAPLQTEHAWGRHPRPTGNILAERYQSARSAQTPVRARLGYLTYVARYRRRRAAERDRRREADANRGDEFQGELVGPECGVQDLTTVFRAVWSSWSLAAGVEGRRLPSAGHAGGCWRVGTLSPRPRLQRNERPCHHGTHAARRDDQALVGTRRAQQCVASRRSLWAALPRKCCPLPRWPHTLRVSRRHGPRA